jgi:magnesium chelatase family protein
VLFLDELAEFGPAALQALRQPVEDGAVRLVRAEGRVMYPARFALVAATNPCPCGFQGDAGGRTCTCTDAVIARYHRRVGGPLLDRIDLAVRVDRLPPERLLDDDRTETSPSVRARVIAARTFALSRGSLSAASLSGRELIAACRMDPAARSALTRCARKLALSGRGVTRAMRVARTIADLAAAERVSADHVYEAAAYRGQAW